MAYEDSFFYFHNYGSKMSSILYVKLRLAKPAHWPRVFTNGPGDWGSIPGQVIPMTLKWYLMPPCLTQHYKVCIKGKVEQSRERGSALPYTSV